MPSPLGKAFGVWRVAKQQFVELFSGRYLVSCISHLISHIYFIGGYDGF